MRILFIHPIPPPHLEAVDIQQGIAALSSVLKREGHQTKLFATFETEDPKLKEVIDGFDPGLIGFCTTSDQASQTAAMARIISGLTDAPMVMGGVHPTVAPELAIQTEHLLGICKGEGEESLPRLVSALENGEDYRQIKGFWFKEGGEIIRNPMPDYIRSLDAYPFPDRAIFDNQRYYNRQNFIAFISGRGCPNICTNCFHHAWKRSYGRTKGYLRWKSTDYIIEEIKEALKIYPYDYIGFHDGDFTIDEVRLEEFCERYAREIDLPFWCNARADNVLRPGVIESLKKGRCVEVHIGVESGSDRVRNEILKKGVTSEQIVEAFRKSREAGLRTFAFNMLGLPTETEAELLETVALNREIQADTIFCSIFNPYPGTDLMTLCADEAWISDRKVISYFEHVSTLDQPSLEAAKVQHYHKLFRILVRRPWMAGIASALDRVKVPGGGSVYDVIDRRVSKLKKDIARRLSSDRKARLKKLLRI